MTDIVIASAVRTAVGAFNGALAETPVVDMGAAVIAEALSRAGISAEEVSEVVMGQVLTGGLGQNPARQAALRAGLPVETPAWVINQVCGSGLRAVILASQALRLGEACVVVAGGQENMTRAPHCAYLRSGKKFGNVDLVDTMISDGLWCALNGYHMGTTAENVANHWKLPRAQQDAFAAASQAKAAAAQKAGRFKDEIVPLTVKAGREATLFEIDEHPRPETTEAVLATLKPAFTPEGSVTAGNASGINDGAAATVVMTAKDAEHRGIEPLARIVAWGQAGVDPALMGIGPVPAIRRALAQAGWLIEDVDLFEINEAFAAQSLAVINDLNLDPDKVNVNGGAIALGHPLGASGTRILVTLLHEMKRRGAAKGVAALCIGGGMGVALCVERP